MKNAYTLSQTGYHTEEPAVKSEGLIASWVRFWFSPADPIGLHIVRIAAGLLFLAWLLPLAGNVESLFGLQGWFDRQAYVEAAKFPGGLPKPTSWSVLYLANGNPAVLTSIYVATLAIFILFTAGIWTRVTSVLTWVLVASYTTNPALNPDADAYLLILSLYLMVGYVLMAPAGKNRSRLAWALGWTSVDRFKLSKTKDSISSPSVGANVALRLLQVHLAIVVVTSGLHKLQYADWWSGNAFWYPLFPPFEATLAVARSYAPVADFFMGVLSLAAYVTLAWQITFPLFTWRPRWRFLLIGGAIVGWLGSAFLFGIPLVGPAVFIGCLSYVTAQEWQRVFGLLNRIPLFNRSTQWLSGSPENKGRIRKDQVRSAPLATTRQS